MVRFCHRFARFDGRFPPKAGNREPAVIGACVYILCNRRNGAGVAADLGRRVWEHRGGIGSQHCVEHGITRLVHVERFEAIVEAITRAKALKKWKRDWKVRLIGEGNPDWRDLWFDINK